MIQSFSRITQTIVITATLTGLSGCFSQATVDEKLRSIASIWNSGSDSEASLDFSQLKIGAPQSIEFELEDGSYCSCTLTSKGEEVNGSLGIQSCVYSDSNSQDPGCILLVGNYSFRSIDTSTLEVCDQNGSCYLY